MGSMDDIRKVFNKFDKNGDGKISGDELREILLALGSGATVEEVARMMRELDKDGDGYIDLDEFTAEFQRAEVAAGEDGADQSVASNKELKDAFDLYDIDGNGLISASELHSVLKKLGESCSLRDCKKMISQVDKDGDGHVNFEEFKKMMSNSP